MQSHMICMAQRFIFNTWKTNLMFFTRFIYGYIVVGFLLLKYMTIIIFNSWEWEKINLVWNCELSNIQNWFFNLKVILYIYIYIYIYIFYQYS
jgi:hypothetical protein